MVKKEYSNLIVNRLAVITGGAVLLLTMGQMQAQINHPLSPGAAARIAREVATADLQRAERARRGVYDSPTNRMH